MRYNLITVLGPTAAGKTKFAAQLCNKFDGEIISCDSRQVYKRMSIGTGKDLSDYKINNKKISYHLIDIAEPETEFNLYNYIAEFFKVYYKIKEKNKIPFLVGGTGLYLNAVLQNYDLKKIDADEDYIKYLKTLTENNLKKILLELNPKQHNTTDLINKERMIKAVLVAQSKKNLFKKKEKINSLIIGVRLSREEIKKRITERLKKRLEQGMVDEVRSLLRGGITYQRLFSLGLEYKFIALHLKEELSYDKMFEKLNTAIHQFAKRQMTWFRKMEREGAEINWVEGADLKAAKEIIIQKYYADIPERS